jgi:hypothetical protein
MEENISDTKGSTESNAPRLERWEELYIKYAEAVKNPTNIYLGSAED